MILRQHLCRRGIARTRTVTFWKSIHTPSFVQIQDGTFYTSYPSASNATPNPPLFPHLDFSLSANKPRSKDNEHWAIVSSSSLARTTFLKILAGSLICIPPQALSYPYLSQAASHPSTAISYIGFDAERTGPSAVRGAYLSARYESRKEETDFTLQDYLTGNTELNPLERSEGGIDQTLYEQRVKDLKLTNLLPMPVGNLSNGQTRRARIAKALMASPELLLLDGPFMGLDPPSVSLLSGVLRSMADMCSPRIVLSLRRGDLVPDWITHLVDVEDTTSVRSAGPKSSVLTFTHISAGSDSLARPAGAPVSNDTASGDTLLSVDGFTRTPPLLPTGEPLLERQGATVSYADSPIPVLGGWSGGLHLTLRANQRLALLGPNGSGKTTLLSLITSDHPQAYAQPVRVFGRSRVPDRQKGEEGLSIFELQRRIGHASPEVHAFFPRGLTVRRALESAWADAPMSKPKLGGAERRRVERALAWFSEELRGGFGDRSAASTSQDSEDGEESVTRQTTKVKEQEADLDWAKDMRFGELSFSSQRLILFLRAIIAGQEIIVLDEAFSGMDKAVREKAFLFLACGDSKVRIQKEEEKFTIVDSGMDSVIDGISDKQALLVVAHDKGDVPGCVREWMCLPEPAGPGEEQKPPRTGVLPGPLELNPGAWEEIWGVEGRS